MDVLDNQENIFDKVFLEPHSCQKNYLSLKPNQKKLIGIAGIPFDSGCTYRNGSRFGPQSVRQQSMIIRPFNLYHKFDPFHAHECVDLGDFNTNPFNIAKSVEMIETQLTTHYNNYTYYVTSHY